MSMFIEKIGKKFEKNDKKNYKKIVKIYQKNRIKIYIYIFF